MSTTHETKKQNEIDQAYAHRDNEKVKQENKMWADHEKSNRKR